MSESHSVYKINPLKGSKNYPTWKIKMIDIFMDLDLIKYADETKKALADTAAKATWAQCKKGGDIEEHIRTLRSYQEELAALRHAVEEEDFSITLLTSLPESWNTFISSIDTADLKDSYKLISRVLQEDIPLHRESNILA
ncbi:hypothetical protein ARMGADRAFT_1038807 [Armillaria gallica]|uniref:DUF4219 domain-containing protein n=1 Tax=Armillaria gallica TaxID=47427 RepID=A0A2H3D3X7_ARMGA|nr:hypothetical protein ARMGADRAFT_1038807 [Armillaria gallica]